MADPVELRGTEHANVEVGVTWREREGERERGRGGRERGKG